MANDKPVSEWTDAEVYRECVRLFGFDPNPLLEGGAPLLSRMVLDAMQARGWQYRIQGGGKRHYCDFAKYIPKRMSCEVFSERPDRAICEAAIQALKQE